MAITGFALRFPEKKICDERECLEVAVGEKKTHQQYSFIPFSSLQEKRHYTEYDPTYKEHMHDPGPGSYLSLSQKNPTKQCISFNTSSSKALRMKSTEVPGPGSYNLSRSWSCEGSKLVAKNDPTHPVLCSINALDVYNFASSKKLHSAPLGHSHPSIPSTSLTYGYEETEEGELVKREPLLEYLYSPEGTLFPGGNNSTSCPTKGCIDFGKYAARRSYFDINKKHEAEEKISMWNSFSHMHEKEKQSTDQALERTDRAARTARLEKKSPQKGLNLIHNKKFNFVRMVRSPVINEDIEENEAFIESNASSVSLTGLTSKKGSWSKSSRFEQENLSTDGFLPSPGSYNIPSAFNVEKKNLNFCNSAPRFAPPNVVDNLPGPGQYDPRPPISYCKKGLRSVSNMMKEVGFLSSAGRLPRDKKQQKSKNIFTFSTHHSPVLVPPPKSVMPVDSSQSFSNKYNSHGIMSSKTAKNYFDDKIKARIINTNLRSESSFMEDIAHADSFLRPKACANYAMKSTKNQNGRCSFISREKESLSNVYPGKYEVHCASKNNQQGATFSKEARFNTKNSADEVQDYNYPSYLHKKSFNVYFN